MDVSRRKPLGFIIGEGSCGAIIPAIAELLGDGSGASGRFPKGKPGAYSRSPNEFPNVRCVSGLWKGTRRPKTAELRRDDGLVEILKRANLEIRRTEHEGIPSLLQLDRGIWEL